MTKPTLALDIGGSSVKSGLFNRDAYSADAPLLSRYEPVEIVGNSFADVRTAVISAVRNGLEESGATEVGISTTGSVWPNGVVKSAGHFDGYQNIDWAEVLQGEFPDIQRVSTENDGKASAWAEFSYFGEEGGSHVHFVLGTGVGSSTIVNGSLMHGDSGEAGFLGHTVVADTETIMCSCDRPGCVETIASAPGLVHETNRRMNETISTFDEYKSLLELENEAAVASLMAACRGLGLISAILVNSINPKNITFGGGVILGIREATSKFATDSLFLEAVKKEIDRVAFYRSANSTSLHYGVFDNDGGLVGAALLATGS